MLRGLTDVGSLNADFAERFARRERITVTGGSLRGDRGRRIQYFPVAGRARQFTLGGPDAAIFASERVRPPVVSHDSGALELF